MVWAATYDSFGNARIDIADVTNNLRLPGQYFDAETGLHYNWYRYYNPQTGRYLQTDPLMDGLNLYSYVRSRPLMYIDPYGLCGMSGSELFHTVIDVIGWVDPTGIADGVNAVVYVFEGDYGNAMVSGVSMIPFGDVLKLLKYGGKYGDDVVEAVSKKAKPRFIADETGNIVDTYATPPGRYIQPDKSATDILQDASHPGLDDFTSRTHTHEATVNVNPNDPTKGTTKLSKHPRPVTTEDVHNIVNGIATPSRSRGH